MKRVALLTTFYEVDSAYSLVTVAENQLEMLIAHNYEPVVLVDRGFIGTQKPLWQPHNVDIRAVVPPIGSQPYEVTTVLAEHLEGIDVCITHDIVFQHDYKAHYAGLKAYASSREDILWLNWVHSTPLGNYHVPPGYIVYPNFHDKGLVCRAYGLFGQEHKVLVSRASHSIDPLKVWNYAPLTKAILDRFDLMAGEVSVVYPILLNKGKQPEKIIRLLAGVQAAGYEPRLLICDWQSTGETFQAYKDELLQLANSLGLEGKVAFTSRLHDDCHLGVPRQVVQELLDLSNVYVHPSQGETYSLSTHEAICRGLLVVANHDVAANMELWGNNVIYMDFGSHTEHRTYRPTEQVFWDDQAKTLMAELKHGNRALWAKTQARRLWSPGAMWTEFESLLYTPIC